MRSWHCPRLEGEKGSKGAPGGIAMLDLGIGITGRATRDFRNKYGCALGTRSRWALAAPRRRNKMGHGKRRNLAGNSETVWGTSNKGRDSIHKGNVSESNPSGSHLLVVQYRSLARLYGPLHVSQPVQGHPSSN